MLGYLSRDLEELRMLLPVAPSETKAAILTFSAEMRKLQERLGRPVDMETPGTGEAKDEPPYHGDAPTLRTRRGLPQREPRGGDTPPPQVRGLREGCKECDAAGTSPSGGRRAEPADDPPLGGSPRAFVKLSGNPAPRGPRYTQFQKTYPDTEVWIQAGLIPRAAKALVEAGIRSPEDLRERCREEVLAIRGLGLGQLEKCERLLGRKLPRATDYWTANGLHLNTAKVLARAGLLSITDVEGMTREQILFIAGIGEVAIRQGPTCSLVRGVLEEARVRTKKRAQALEGWNPQPGGVKEEKPG
jgi:Helix-hairpin-helix domain